ncbi:MAG: hypothetical protein ABSA62_06490 [Methyloceanibacter sp.]
MRNSLATTRATPVIFWRMGRAALLTLIVLAASNQAAAQIRILTPNLDSCLAYTTALDTDDEAKLGMLSGWTAGFFSGVAQGMGIDFLRNIDGETLARLLYDYCHRQPDKLLSLAAEEVARSIIAEKQNH